MSEEAVARAVTVLFEGAKDIAAALVLKALAWRVDFVDVVEVWIALASKHTRSSLMYNIMDKMAQSVFAK